MFAVLFYARPNVKLAGFKWVTPGALLAIVVWLVASAAFAFYVANFGSYDKTYGTLGGMVCLLVWMWITNVALLLGMELNSERERSRELDAGRARCRPRAAARRPLEAQAPEDHLARPQTTSPTLDNEGGTTMATQSPSASATDNAKEQVQEKAQEAQEKLKGGAQQAQARMREQVDQRSTQAGEQVSATADALRTTSRICASRARTAPRRPPRRPPTTPSASAATSASRAPTASSATSRTSAVASRWRSSASAWRPGSLASRFLKASSRERYESYYQSRSTATAAQPVPRTTPRTDVGTATPTDVRTTTPTDGGYGV